MDQDRLSESVSKKRRISMLAALCFAVACSGAGGAQASTAPALIKQLRVSSEKNTGYDRDLFNIWTDADSDGCDTRDEVLYRQNTARPRSCGSDAGRWVSVYDGKKFTDASDLDVDHMVPLAEAFGSGAWSWSSATREAYANDLYKLSLIAVSAASNRSKSDRDPAEWLPPKKSYVCRYVANWTAVKYRWRLTVDGRERKALNKTFSSCSKAALKLPAIPRASVKQSPVNPDPEPGGTDPRFDTCTAAKAAGYGPHIRWVDPEYDWYRQAHNHGHGFK